MKNIAKTLFLSAFVALFLVPTSCREESDDIPTLGGKNANFESAEASLTGLFESIWMAMNCNYPIWDYEQEQFGVDWDAVYKEYHPKFEALDLAYCKNGEYQKSEELNDTVRQLYQEIFGLLHDGHMYLTIYHTKTGVEIPFPGFHPVNDRNGKRSDYNDPQTTMSYYLDSDDENQIKEHYSEEYPFKLEYYRFKDDILYLRVKDFDLDYLLNDEKIADSLFSSYIPEFLNERNYWRQWFNDVQKAHAEGRLRGIIIDLRNNPGGDAISYQYIVGALQLADTDSTKQIGFVRNKTGVGRLDYSPIRPVHYSVYTKEHAEITEPVILLTNCKTASMAEVACLGAKTLKNGLIIGTRTHGGLGLLKESEARTSTYDQYYVGSVGYEFNGSYYIQLPSTAFFTLERKCLEGVGIEPDIEVALDIELYRRTGRDNQLERALEYIRTGR